MRSNHEPPTHAGNCLNFAMSRARKTLSCFDCFAKFVQLDVAHFFEYGYSFLFVFLDGLGQRSILQPVHQSVYFGYPSLLFADDVLRNSMTSEIDLKRASFFDDTVLATVSRNSLNNLVFTIVSVLLQFRATP